jgi:hypothetical protein
MSWFAKIIIGGYIASMVVGLLLLIGDVIGNLGINLRPLLDSNNFWWLALIGVWIYVVGGAAIRQDKESERCRRPPL